MDGQFHQPNLRAIDAPVVRINGQDKQLSLLQMWVETVVDEVTKTVNWPIITLKHDDVSSWRYLLYLPPPGTAEFSVAKSRRQIALSFAERYARDQCTPYITYTLSPNASSITAVTVMTDGNNCPVPVPVTFPGNVTDTKDMVTEQIGNDPLTIWVKLAGRPMTFNLTSPISV